MSTVIAVEVPEDESHLVESRGACSGDSSGTGGIA